MFDHILNVVSVPTSKMPMADHQPYSAVGAADKEAASSCFLFVFLFLDISNIYWSYEFHVRFYLQMGHSANKTIYYKQTNISPHLSLHAESSSQTTFTYFRC